MAQTPTIVTIANGGVTVKVSSLGAEVQSIVRDGIEYLWQGDPKYWGRRAPVLFPIVGRLRGDHATCEKGDCDMKQHGVARNEEFELVASDERHATWRLHANETTLALFPYEFELLMTYDVDEDGVLSCTFTVENLDDATLPFTLGGHPAFNCPMDDKHGFTDYELVFMEPWYATSPVLSDGLLDYDEAFTIVDMERTVPLNHEMFDKRDTFIFQNVPGNFVELHDKDDEHGVVVSFDGFDYLGVWSAAGGAPFVALEPWCGTATRTDESDRLEDKAGMVKLPPRDTFTRTFTISVR